MSKSCEDCKHCEPQQAVYKHNCKRFGVLCVYARHKTGQCGLQDLYWVKK